MTNRTTFARGFAFVAAAAFAVASVAPASAADPGSDAAKTVRVDPSNETVKPTKPSKERRYCVKPASTTGTILTKSVCRTRAQWIAITGVDPAQ
ncbi:hypothetical protein [Sphingomonas sp. M1-B02]|uniref:hypothetical protein n=1 Tax=Sphingomonas sp. M1-B02 TaxID=3114300 RepID=UPI00223ED812|nr:hypothetical protein [Sphingomonas sp. S6-11]UZK67356.1 hypothetical protein OKW87_05850 [Sphingomonas sp. S6-11]